MFNCNNIFSIYILFQLFKEKGYYLLIDFLPILTFFDQLSDIFYQYQRCHCKREKIYWYCIDMIDIVFFSTDYLDKMCHTIQTGGQKAAPQGILGLQNLEPLELWVKFYYFAHLCFRNLTPEMDSAPVRIQKKCKLYRINIYKYLKFSIVQTGIRHTR